MQIGRALKELGAGGTLLCVDTWLGSLEHWRDSVSSPEWSQSRLKIRNGEPTFLQDFWKNIQDNNLLKVVSICRSTTQCAHAYLSKSGYQADLIYVDADHSFSSVRQDLRFASDLLSESKSSLIVGDDWDWVSVRLAALTFSMRTGKQLMSAGNTFALVDAGNGTAKGTIVELGFQRVNRIPAAAKTILIGIRNFIYERARKKLPARLVRFLRLLSQNRSK